MKTLKSLKKIAAKQAAELNAFNLVAEWLDRYMNELDINSNGMQMSADDLDVRSLGLQQLTLEYCDGKSVEVDGDLPFANTVGYVWEVFWDEDSYVFSLVVESDGRVTRYERLDPEWAKFAEEFANF